MHLYLPSLLPGSPHGRNLAGLMWRRHIFMTSELCCPSLFYPDLQSNRKHRGEAEFIEQQIAERETRLF
jgi:hypothetical protein